VSQGIEQPVTANAAESESPNPNASRMKTLALQFARKVIGFVAMGFFMGFLADFAATRNNPDKPAGLAWGMVHGALMPTALPALIMGKDVTIYAPHNKGRVYKIGYAGGVNICGLLFFGLVFWNPRKPEPTPAPEAPKSP